MPHRNIIPYTIFEACTLPFGQIIELSGLRRLSSFHHQAYLGRWDVVLGVAIRHVDDSTSELFVSPQAMHSWPICQFCFAQDRLSMRLAVASQDIVLDTFQLKRHFA